jgi:hypothetical protein
MYKILEKYIHLKTDQNSKNEENTNNLLQVEEEIVKEFLNLYDKDVKTIHHNQLLIDKDLQVLYKETEKLANTTKIAVDIYDGFLDYLKVSGDLVNWCSMIEKEMCEMYDQIATKQRGNYMNNIN